MIFRFFFFLVTGSWGVFNELMPIGLRCDSEAIKATKLKLTALMYVPGARFGGPCSDLGECGGSVALMVVLQSCFAALLEHAPLSSHRSGRQVRVWGYGQAL